MTELIANLRESLEIFLLLMVAPLLLLLALVIVIVVHGSSYAI